MFYRLNGKNIISSCFIPCSCAISRHAYTHPNRLNCGLETVTRQIVCFRCVRSFSFFLYLSFYFYFFFHALIQSFSCSVFSLLHTYTHTHASLPFLFYSCILKFLHYLSLPLSVYRSPSLFFTIEYAWSFDDSFYKSLVPEMKHIGSSFVFITTTNKIVYVYVFVLNTQIEYTDTEINGKFREKMFKGLHWRLFYFNITICTNAQIHIHTLTFALAYIDTHTHTLSPHTHNSTGQ